MQGFGGKYSAYGARVYSDIDLGEHLSGGGVSMHDLGLRYLAQLLGSVPLFRVDVPWNLERLGEVHEAICLHRGDFNLRGLLEEL